MQFSLQLPYILTFQDVYLTPLYLIIIYLIVRKWRKRYDNTPVKKYIYPALLCRMTGCIVLSLILNFYYGYGDTFSYFTGAHEIWNAFIHSPKIAWEIITTAPNNYSGEAMEYALHSGDPNLAFSYYAMFRISGIIGLLCFGSYLPIALVLSLLSFWGTWMIFIVFEEEFPQLRKAIAVSTLFIPSVIIWTTGILKEPLCMFALGLCFYSFHNILKGRNKKNNILYFILGSVILLILKDYIFYLFAVAAVVWSYKTFIGSINATLLKLTIKIFIYVAFLSTIIYFLNTDSNYIQNFAAEYFKRIENLQTVMTTINADYNSGSGYALPTNDFSGFGLFKSFMLSINVSLFRPYLWECNNFLMVLNFLESFATMLFIIFILFKPGIVNIYRNLKKPVLLFSFIFSILMAALVGFASFNFGTLIRYKTPFEPFFFTLLVIILLNKTANLKKDNSMNLTK